MKKDFVPNMDTTDPFQIIKENSMAMHRMTSNFGKFTEHNNQINTLKESHEHLINNFTECCQEMEKGQKDLVGKINDLKITIDNFNARLVSLEKSQQWDFLKSELEDIEVSYNDLHKRIIAQNEKLVEAIFEKQSGVINKNVDKLDKGISKISDKFNSFIEDQQKKDQEAANTKLANANKKSSAIITLEELKQETAQLKTENSKMREQFISSNRNGRILHILTTIILSVLIYYFSHGSTTPASITTDPNPNFGNLGNVNQLKETPVPTATPDPTLNSKEKEKKRGKK